MKNLIKSLGIILYLAVFFVAAVVLFKVIFYLSIIILGVCLYFLFPYWRKLRDWTEKKLK